jgi:hypothetical protein
MAISLQALDKVLSYAEPVSAVLLLTRLWHSGLLRRYRRLALYLLSLIAELIPEHAVERYSDEYLRAFVAVESAQWLFQILVILEMFAIVLHDYPAINAYWRRFIVVALVAAAVLSGLFAVFIHQAGPGQYPLVDEYMLVSRVIAFTLLAFFILLLGFLFWFPVPLSRNAVVYTIGFAVYFGSRALIRLASNLAGPDTLPVLSCVSLSIVVVCLLFWTLAISRKGEEVNVTVGHRWQPDESAALIQQLESINAVLLRTARK